MGGWTLQGFVPDPTNGASQFRFNRSGSDVSLTTPDRVARHVEPRIAGVLHVEDAGAGTDRPGVAGRPGPSDPRSEIQLVVIDQTPAQGAVAGDLDVRIESDIQPLVEVALADPDEHGMTRQVRDGQPLVAVRQVGVHQRAALVEPRRRVFVAQSVIERHVPAHAPRVVEVVRLADRAEPCGCERNGCFRQTLIAEQEIGKRRGPRCRHPGQGTGGPPVELERPSRELIAVLVELVEPDAFRPA